MEVSIRFLVVEGAKKLSGALMLNANYCCWYLYQLLTFGLCNLIARNKLLGSLLITSERDSFPILVKNFLEYFINSF